MTLGRSAAYLPMVETLLRLPPPLPRGTVQGIGVSEQGRAPRPGFLLWSPCVAGPGGGPGSLLPSEGDPDYHVAMPSYELGSPADPMLGKQIEGYRVVRVVGKGGMGIVYEAVHAEIGQRAAVKILFPEFSTDVDAVGRFVAEARAASKVRHAGLVQIFYSGRLDDGTAYIMMEFLDGESIEERLRRLSREGKRIESSAVARIGQQVASALSAVHREGIVHRDLKPANLILVSEPEIEGGERIKVVDFGIAKFDRAHSEIGKTTVGRFLGTALYASPEQCQMAGEVGPKADVYSLGVLLYEMVSGKPPFVADQPGRVIGMHLFLQPRPLWEVARDVHPPLHRLIHQMLAKAPEKRPSMQEVAALLDASKLERPSILWRLRNGSMILAAAGGLMAVLGAGVASRLWYKSRAPQLAPLPAAAPMSEPVPVAPLTPERPTDMAMHVDVSSRAALPAPATSIVPEPGSVMEPESEKPRKTGRRGSRRRLDQVPTPESAAATTARPPASEPSPTRQPAPPAPTPAAEPSRIAKPDTPPKTHAEPTKDDDGILR